MSGSASSSASPRRACRADRLGEVVAGARGQDRERGARCPRAPFAAAPDAAVAAEHRDDLGALLRGAPARAARGRSADSDDPDVVVDARGRAARASTRPISAPALAPPGGGVGHHHDRHDRPAQARDARLGSAGRQAARGPASRGRRRAIGPGGLQQPRRPSACGVVGVAPRRRPASRSAPAVSASATSAAGDRGIGAVGGGGLDHEAATRRTARGPDHPGLGVQEVVRGRRCPAPGPGSASGRSTPSSVATASSISFTAVSAVSLRRRHVLARGLARGQRVDRRR